MELPSTPSHFDTERLGVEAVASSLFRLKQIWRETPSVDVGIDGQIEFRSPDGKATGQLVAVQIKSGRSHFKDHGEEWHFYPEGKHRFYWERFPIPVLLCLHDPDAVRTFWCDARQWLRSSKGKAAYIAVPKTQVLETSTAEELFHTAGPAPGVFLPIPLVLEEMISAQCPEAAFPVSYFELFVHGLTNLCNSLYFGMDVPMQVAEFNLSRAHSEFGVGIGSNEHEFLWSYVRFLLTHQLADIRFSDCLADWDEMELHPMFIAKLTSRGRQLIDLIGERETTFRRDGKVASGGRHVYAAQEAYVGVLLTPGTVARFPVIASFLEASRQK